MNEEKHEKESAAEISRKRFLQRMGMAGAGAMLGGAMAQNAAFAAPETSASTRDGARLAQAPQNRPANAANAPANARGAQILGETDVRSFGARGDGKTDDTRAFQAAIDEASSRGGGTIFVPQGRYFFAGELNLPAHVTLRGVSEIPDVPDDNWGSVLLVTAGKGNANGQPFITMARASVLKGITIRYPDQPITPVPTPYPWTVRGIGDNIGIVDCLFLNPYQAVDFGTNPCGRHYIRNLYSHALYRGLFVDQCYDIGRCENIHFWPFASQDPKHFEWLQQNAVAFMFGRTDWQYLSGCFTIFYKIGFHFADFGHGPGNVLLTNSGADVGTVTAQVDATQSHAGVTFVNAQMNGTLRVADTNAGPVKFTGSSFYGSGKTDSSADIGGNGRVSFDNCHFTWWDQNNNDSPALRVRNGHVGVTNCEFFGARNHIVLERDVRNATIMGSHFRPTMRINNRSRGKVHLVANTDVAPAPPANIRRQFFNGFEPNQPQPLLNKIEVVAHQNIYSVRVGSGGRSGRALFLEGKQAEKSPGTAYFRIFDGLKIPITPDTVFRYWIRAGNPEARFCALDLVLDGDKRPRFLREAENAVDLEEQRMHPAYARGASGEWVRIESPIGKWLAGRTVTAILAAHDGTGTAPFVAAFDDIEIGTGTASR